MEQTEHIPHLDSKPRAQNNKCKLKTGQDGEDGQCEVQNSSLMSSATLEAGVVVGKESRRVQSGATDDETSAEVHQCESCDYRSIFPPLLTAHRRVHTASKCGLHQLRCTKCPFSCAKIAGLRHHVAGHAVRPKLRLHCCKNCSFMSTEMSLIEGHMSEQHPQLEDESFYVRKVILQYDCTVCQISGLSGIFNTEEAYIIHFKDHPDKNLLESYVLTSYGMSDHEAVDNSQAILRTRNEALVTSPKGMESSTSDHVGKQCFQNHSELSLQDKLLNTNVHPEASEHPSRTSSQEASERPSRTSSQEASEGPQSSQEASEGPQSSQEASEGPQSSQEASEGPQSSQEASEGPQSSQSQPSGNKQDTQTEDGAGQVPLRKESSELRPIRENRNIWSVFQRPATNGFRTIFKRKRTPSLVKEGPQTNGTSQNGHTTGLSFRAWPLHKDHKRWIKQKLATLTGATPGVREPGALPEGVALEVQEPAGLPDSEYTTPDRQESWVSGKPPQQAAYKVPEESAKFQLRARSGRKMRTCKMAAPLPAGMAQLCHKSGMSIPDSFKCPKNCPVKQCPYRTSTRQMLIYHWNRTHEKDYLPPGSGDDCEAQPVDPRNGYPIEVSDMSSATVSEKELALEISNAHTVSWVEFAAKDTLSTKDTLSRIEKSCTASSVAFEDRISSVASEDRISSVASEDRISSVASEGPKFPSDIIQSQSPFDSSDSEEEELPSAYAQRMCKVPGKSLLKCSRCMYMSWEAALVNQHYSMCHVIEGYRCGYCLHQKLTRYDLQTHSSQEHPECRPSILSLSQLALHSPANSPIPLEEVEEHVARLVSCAINGLRTCLLCKEEKHDRVAMKIHVYTKHLNFIPYTCKYCEYSAVEMSLVEAHVKTNHPNCQRKVLRNKFHGLLPGRSVSGNSAISPAVYVDLPGSPDSFKLDVAQPEDSQRGDESFVDRIERNSKVSTPPTIADTESLDKAMEMSIEESTPVDISKIDSNDSSVTAINSHEASRPDNDSCLTQEVVSSGPPQELNNNEVLNTALCESLNPGSDNSSSSHLCSDIAQTPNFPPVPLHPTLSEENVSSLGAAQELESEWKSGSCSSEAGQGTCVGVSRVSRSSFQCRTAMKSAVEKTLTQYQCLLCKIKRDRPNLIMSHILHVHLRLQRYKCSLCTFQNKLKFLVSRHVKKHGHDCKVINQGEYWKQDILKRMQVINDSHPIELSCISHSGKVQSASSDSATSSDMGSVQNSRTSLKMRSLRYATEPSRHIGSRPKNKGGHSHDMRSQYAERKKYVGSHFMPSSAKTYMKDKAAALLKKTKDKLKKPRYVCPLCKCQSFNCSDSARVHIMKELNYLPYKCGVRGCQQRFTYICRAKLHTKACHAKYVSPIVKVQPRKQDLVRSLMGKALVTKQVGLTARLDSNKKEAPQAKCSKVYSESAQAGCSKESFETTVTDLENRDILGGVRVNPVEFVYQRGRFSCRHCMKKTWTRTGMREHLIAYHLPFFLWQCPYCPMRDKFRKTVFRHQREKHQKRKQGLKRILVKDVGILSESNLRWQFHGSNYMYGDDDDDSIMVQLPSVRVKDICCGSPGELKALLARYHVTLRKYSKTPI